MATIHSQLQLRDSMSESLHKIITLVNTCVSSFQQLQTVSSQEIGGAGISVLQDSLTKTDEMVKEVADSCKDMQSALDSATDTSGVDALTKRVAQIDGAVKKAGEGLKQVENQHKRVNSAVKAGSDGLLKKIDATMAAYLSLQGAQKLFGLADGVTMTPARLELIVDDGGSVMELQSQISDMANRVRAPVQDVSASIAKMGMLAGESFSGNDELIAFTELMNKNFAIGGSSIQEQTAAMYQLTQAMAAGKLQGDEYRSIMEGAPLLYQAIDKYLKNMDIEGTMKDWASNGLITADVIKQALFSTADEVNERYKSLPMTWSQLWTVASNDILSAFQPVLETIGSGAQWVYDNWDTVSDVLSRVAWAIGGVATAIGIWRVATGLMTVAQQGLNAALLANPLGLVIALVLVLALAFGYLWDNYESFRQHFIKGTSDSAKVFGDFYNGVFVPVSNGIIRIQHDVVDTIANGCQAMIKSFASLGRFVLENFSSIMTKTSEMMEMYNSISGILHLPTIDIKHIQSPVQAVNDLESLALKTLDDVSGMLKPGSYKPLDLEKYEAAIDGYGSKANDFRFGDLLDSFNMFKDTFTPETPSFVADANPYLPEIAENTGSTAAAMGDMSEEVAYMRDIAEREAVNRFTTASIQFDMSNMTNRLDSSLDVDGFVSQLSDGILEASLAAAEGVHQG